MSPERALRRQSRLTTLVLVLSLVSVALMAVIALFGLPRIFSSADNSGAVRRGSELQSCRSSYSSRVTDATTAANDLILRGLAAVGRGDEDELRRLVTDPPGAEKAPIDRARELVRVRAEAFSEAVRLSRQDPDRFLVRCRRAFDGEAITSCAVAEALGVAPLTERDEGYRKALDSDGDGVACE